MTVELPDWVTFPEDDWVEITIEEAGLDPETRPLKSTDIPFGVVLDGLS